MNVMLTGGSGFLGQCVCQGLRREYHYVSNPSHTDLNLLNRDAVRRFLKYGEPFDAIVHLAAMCGGIGVNQERPGEFFYNNLMMGVMLMEEARKVGVKKFVSVGTVCSYPKYTPVPFKESDIWKGYPEETNAPYGLAKKMLLVQSQTYRDQYGFNAVYLIPVNLYGPGDNFNPRTSHVIPAIIRKVDQAIQEGRDEVLLWGSGKVSREFLYVEDAAKGICDALNMYNGREPINLGTGRSITISRLAADIADEMGYTGEFLWDTSRPDGQPKRCLDISRAEKLLKWNPQMDLREGLEKTIDWWRDHAQD